MRQKEMQDYLRKQMGEKNAKNQDDFIMDQYLALRN